MKPRSTFDKIGYLVILAIWLVLLGVAAPKGAGPIGEATAYAIAATLVFMIVWNIAGAILRRVGVLARKA